MGIELPWTIEQQLISRDVSFGYLRRQLRSRLVRIVINTHEVAMPNLICIDTHAAISSKSKELNSPGRIIFSAAKGAERSPQDPRRADSEYPTFSSFPERLRAERMALNTPMAAGVKLAITRLAHFALLTRGVYGGTPNEGKMVSRFKRQFWCWLKEEVVNSVVTGR